MIPSTDITNVAPARIQTATLPKPSPVTTPIAPPHVSNRKANTSNQWIPLPHAPMAAVPSWLLPTAHGAVAPATAFPLALPNGPAISRAGILAATPGTDAKSADDPLMNWISTRKNKSPVQATTDSSPTLQPAPPWRTNPRDIELQRIIDEWKLTGQINMGKVWSYVVTGASYSSRAAGFMKRLDLVDELLHESEPTRLRLVEDLQFDELARETFVHFLRIARNSTTKPENEPIRRQVVSRFRHVLHHHPGLLRMFDSYCANASNRSRLTNCRMTISIKALRYLRDSAIRMSDNDLDELFSASTDTPSTWNDIQQAIRSRLRSSTSPRTRPPLRSMPSESSEGVCNAGSCGTSASNTTSSLSGDVQGPLRQARKRQPSECTTEENGAPAKRHRTENSGGLASPVSEPSPSHRPAAPASSSNDLRNGLSASSGSINPADIGDAPSSDLNEMASWLSPPLFEGLTDPEVASKGPAATFNDNQITESQQGSDDSFWEKFFQEPCW